MSIIINPEIRNTSDLPFHTDDAPGDRIVFVEEKMFSQSEFYIMGRRVNGVPERQIDYVYDHKHNCNSFHIFIGDNEDLTGLNSNMNVEGKSYELQSPSTFFIPANLLHHYKLTKGNGWFFNIILSGDFNKSLVINKNTELLLHSTPKENLYKRAEKNFKKVSDSERPLTSSVDSIINPSRWIFVDPNMIVHPGAYIALHQISSDKAFQYCMKLHHHKSDEVYILLGRNNSELEIDLIDGNLRRRLKSPIAIYHPRYSDHRYEYVSGEGLILIVLKESIPGEGYKFILA